ncbi:MAG: hypothetical protein II376_06630, partial [Clostridia bacterium]|nr:hypothetical protein [Clostridia bacterium]
MSLKDFTKEKIASAIKSGAKEIGVETAVFSAIKLIDHKNEANSLSEKARKSQSETKNSVSTESFFSESANPIIRLTMKEKIMSLRKHYVIQDNLGNIVFTVKSEGFLGGPKLGLYDVNEQKIGLVEKHSSNNPA